MALLKPAFPRLQRGHPLARGLVGSFELTEGSGLTAHDSSGCGHHGTLTGGATWVGGRAGSALSLSGAGQYVSFPALNITGFISITAWIYSKGTQNIYSGIVHWKNIVGERPGLGASFGATPTPNQLGYEWNDNNWQFNSGLIIPDNKWAFVALVVEPAKATLYMHDGSTLLSAVNTTSLAATNFNANGDIGVDEQNVTSRAFFGIVDCVRIYDRALSGEEIRFIYATDSQGLFKPSSAGFLSVLAGEHLPPVVESKILHVVSTNMRW